MCVDKKTMSGIFSGNDSDVKTYIPAGIHVATDGTIKGPFVKGNRMTAKKAHEKQDFDSQLTARRKVSTPHTDDFT